MTMGNWQKFSYQIKQDQKATNNATTEQTANWNNSFYFSSSTKEKLEWKGKRRIAFDYNDDGNDNGYQYYVIYQ